MIELLHFCRKEKHPHTNLSKQLGNNATPECAHHFEAWLTSNSGNMDLKQVLILTTLQYASIGCSPTQIVCVIHFSMIVCNIFLCSFNFPFDIKFSSFHTHLVFFFLYHTVTIDTSSASVSSFHNESDFQDHLNFYY